MHRPSELFKAGQRVSAVRFGIPGEGTVTRAISSGRTRNNSGEIVWVRWDVSGRETWMHGESLTPVVGVA